MGGNTSSEESEEETDLFLSEGILPESGAHQGRECKQILNGSITRTSRSFWEEDGLSWISEAWTTVKEALDNFFNEEDIPNEIQGKVLPSQSLEDPAMLLAYAGVSL